MEDEKEPLSIAIFSTSPCYCSRSIQEFPRQQNPEDDWHRAYRRRAWWCSWRDWDMGRRGLWSLRVAAGPKRCWGTSFAEPSPSAPRCRYPATWPSPTRRRLAACWVPRWPLNPARDEEERRRGDGGRDTEASLWSPPRPEAEEGRGCGGLVAGEECRVTV